MLTVLSSGLLLETSAIAQDASIADQPTALPTPAVVQLSDPEIEASPSLGLNLDPQSSEATAAMEQVTSVSQLSDVQPTDWAFQALQSLVERYGCIEGYPDRTYRGNRAMTRYEFAAGLNQCLNQIQALIASATEGISKEDLTTLQRLQAEFSAELASLKGRVDALEPRVARLEAQQFSTTTKLSGQVITYVGDAFGENASDANNATVGYQVFLNLLTSFSGKDSLIVGLESANIRKFDAATEFPAGRLSGSTDETRVLIPAADIYGFDYGDIALSFLQYSFPLGDNLTVFLDAFSSNRILSGQISQFGSMSRGFLSYYGRVNPLTYPVGVQTGIGLKWQVAPWLNIDFSAGSEIGTANDPRVGLFEGGYGASVRPVISLGRLRMTGYYINSYSPAFGIDTFAGSNSAKVVGAGPVVANTYVGAIFYRLTPGLELGGSVGYSRARALGDGTKGDAEVWDYDVNLTFYDLGKKGNTAGLLFAVQPRLAGTSNGRLAEAIGLPAGQRSDRDTGFHIEAFYAHRLNDNITISPGLIWLTAPNHDQRNPDVFVGVIRTTFDF